MKKGFVFTLDAIIATLSAAMLIIASFFYLSQAGTIKWTEKSLYQVSLDSLAVLDLSKSLEDPAKIQNFLDNTFPLNICAKIEIFDSGSVIQNTITKTGCAETGYGATAYRSFIIGKSIFYAKMWVWYR